MLKPILVISLLATPWLLSTSGHAIEIELGNLLIQKRTSTIEPKSSGLAASTDLTLVQPLSPKTSLYLRTLVSYNQNSSFIPLGVDIGARFYGERLSKKIMPYLAGSINYNRSQSNTCNPTDTQTLPCEKNFINLRLGGGFKAKFNRKFYLFTETNFTNAPIYGLITYPDGGKATLIGLKINSTTINPVQAMTFGAGLSF